MYCKFILKYRREFEPIYVEECEKWLASYFAYMNFIEEREKAEEKRRLAREKKEQEEQEKRLKTPLRDDAKQYVLRNS